MQKTSIKEFARGSNSRHAHCWHKPIRSKVSRSRFKILSPQEAHLEVIGGLFRFASRHCKAPAQLPNLRHQLSALQPTPYPACDGSRKRHRRSPSPISGSDGPHRGPEIGLP